MSVRERFYNILMGKGYFKNEFKDQLRILILFTLGFTIAFTWRQTIFDTVQFIVLWFTHIENDTYTSIMTSTVTTALCLLIIYITSRMLQNPHRY